MKKQDRKRKNYVVKNILNHIKKLSEDNIYILLSYAHELLCEQMQEPFKNLKIKDGKQIVEEQKYKERMIKIINQLKDKQKINLAYGFLSVLSVK